MALLSPCTSSSSLLRRNFPIKFGGLRCQSPKFRWRVAVSELQTSVGVSDRVGVRSSEIPTHKVTVHDRQRGVVHEFVVPEDQYILHTAESQNIALPFACRHGCCTSCAVRVKSGEIRQPEALGISAELKSKVTPVSIMGIGDSSMIWLEA